MVLIQIGIKLLILYEAKRLFVLRYKAYRSMLTFIPSPYKAWQSKSMKLELKDTWPVNDDEFVNHVGSNTHFTEGVKNHQKDTTVVFTSC